MYKLIILMFGLLAMVPMSASATDPGTPMNCSDLLLPPGLTCSEFSNPGEGRSFSENDSVIDNEGHIITTSAGDISDTLEELGFCGDFKLIELGLVWNISQGGIRIPVASVRSRCLDETTSTVEGLRVSDILFDSINGALFVSMISTCNSRGDLCNNYNGGGWIARIGGYKPLAAVLPEQPVAPALCNNGIDDDGDGAIDLNDQQCKSAADNDESRP